MDFMTQEDSYADRRRLFKSIWETAMDIDEKDPDIMKKPKVIKTLKLNEVDRCVVGKTKKQRIKNLRTVCNKILDFCDKQDADDVFYEQLATASQQREMELHKVDLQPRKIKRTKKNVKKVQSMFVPITEPTIQKATKGSNHVSPTRSKKNTVIQTSVNNDMMLKLQPNPTNVGANVTGMSGDTSKRRKIYRKKTVKRKKLTQPNVVQSPTGILRPNTREM